MKKKGLSLFITLLLVLSFATLPPTASAHPITVDGNPADWTMTAPTNVNTGHVGRASGTPVQGEYVWTDNGGDERTEYANPDTRVDLTEFRVTADETNLYFMARMTDIDIDTGWGSWGAPQVQVAVDTDRVNGSGGLNLEYGADTMVAGEARWEYLIITRFGGGNADVAVRSLSSPEIHTGAEAIDAGNDCIEFSVPWTALGMSGPPEVLRLTVATFHSNLLDNMTWDVFGESDALDCITNYGDPGDMSNTSSEVSEGVSGEIGYYFDVYFAPQYGEVYSPLLISEVYYDTTGVDSDEEWVQIYNAGPSIISLNNWKLGDEETVDGGEGMHRFFTGVIDPESVVVAAQNGVGFADLGYACGADYEFNDSGSVQDMVAYTAWTGGSPGIFSLSNTGDQVLLLDPCDTVMDVVTWSGAAYPGVTPHFGVPTGSSIQRDPVNADTNDCSADLMQVGSDGSPCNNPTAVVLSSLATVSSGRFGLVPLMVLMGLAAVLPMGAFLLWRWRR